VSPADPPAPAALLATLARADAAQRTGDHATAIAAFADARALAPHDLALGLAHANACRLAGQPEAELAVLRALAAVDDRADLTHTYALGAALLAAGEAALAVEAFEPVARARANDHAALCALAGALRTAGAPERAWPLVRRALALAPDAGPVLLAAAQVRHDLGDLAGAHEWLARAEAARPDHAGTRLQGAWTSLLGGASADGWARYEARALPTPDTPARRWRGEPLAGGSVLVAAEQGIGDLLQFLRFVRSLRTHGAGDVIVECHPHLLPLLSSQPTHWPDVRFVARGTPPVTDWYVPLLSLPLELACDTDVQGTAVPYLEAPRDASDTPPLPAAVPGRRRLGLVWAGNPVFPGRATRDFDVARLPDLVALPDVQWIALQQGPAGDLDLPGVHRLPPLRDWRDTATLLAQLDGLVTTDTGIAHLAGAMGVPTWVLLARVPDWRWGLTGETTPWYPSARLVRATRSGSWAGVVDALHAALQQT